MGKRVTVLVDLDPVVYRVGFSLEDRTYYLQYRDVEVGYEDDPSHDVEHVGFFHNAAARDEFVRLQGLHPDEHASTMVPVPEMNEAIVFGRVKATLRDIETNVGAYLYETGQQVGRVRLFLSGSTNFRNEIATITPYKGSRKNAPRPYWYQGIREYLIKKGATVTDGIEADDAVVMAQYAHAKGDSIICTIDKDLRMARGHFYNYVTKQAEYITELAAMRNFYRQVVMGDSTDDIPGCHKIGKVGAAKIIHDGLRTEKAMYNAALGAYVDNIEEFPAFHLPHTSAIGSLVENARLLWMMRHDDDLWTPPGQPNGSLKGHLENLPPRDLDG